MKRGNKRELRLRGEVVRRLRTDQLAAVGGGAGSGRCTGSGQDCVIECTQSCDQCSMWPECGTQTTGTSW